MNVKCEHLEQQRCALQAPSNTETGCNTALTSRLFPATRKVPPKSALDFKYYILMKYLQNIVRNYFQKQNFGHKSKKNYN